MRTIQASFYFPCRELSLLYWRLREACVTWTFFLSSFIYPGYIHSREILLVFTNNPASIEELDIVQVPGAYFFIFIDFDPEGQAWVPSLYIGKGLLSRSGKVYERR